MTTDSDRREFIQKSTQLPPAQVRELAESNFIIASNILTYNWIQGNPRADWDGKPFQWHPVASGDKHHYGHWYDQIRANDLNMFLSGRKHTKTTFADCLMIWKSEFVAGHASLYWANTEGQVRDRMVEVEEIIKANPWLDSVHNDTARLSKRFENGSRILTTWVTGAFEGGHVDLSLGDDPMKELNDISDEDIESWYGNVIVPVVNPEGLHAIIGTRKRPKDLYYLLRMLHESDDALAGRDLPKYELMEYPAVREPWIDEYGDRQDTDLAPQHLYTEVEAPALANALDVGGDTLSLLWPAARDADFLARNLGGQGRPKFLREYCMVYKQAEDAIVHRAWIARTSEDRTPPRSLTESWKPADYPEPVTRPAYDRVVVGHDPAGSGRDKFAWVTLGELVHPHESLPEQMRAFARDDDGQPVDVRVRHVLDVWQAVEVPPSRWRDKLTSLFDRYRPDAIALESNLNGTWVADDDEIPSRVRKAIEPVATTRRKHSWTEGVPSIGSDVEAGKYRFYSGGGDDNMTTELVTALTGLRYEDGEVVGHTPDLVMALYMGHKYLSDDSGRASSSRASLGSSGSSDADRERERDERERRRKLRGSRIGDAILGGGGRGL